MWPLQVCALNLNPLAVARGARAPAPTMPLPPQGSGPHTALSTLPPLGTPTTPTLLGSGPGSLLRAIALRNAAPLRSRSPQ